MESNDPTTATGIEDASATPSTPAETPADTDAEPHASAAPVSNVAYDFDSWTDEDEDKAIAGLVPDVRHIIVERRFIGRFVDGTVVELPLTLSVDDIDELEVAAASPVDQLKHLLIKIGGHAAAAEFTRHDITETTILASRYFTILQRVAKAALPE